jgi:diguanylate cyclase (GGDEF)-like protein
MIAEMFYSLLNIEVKTLIAVLFWGNFASIILILAYRSMSRSLKDQQLSSYYSFAKILQAVAYFCFFFRGSLPDLVSVNLGNSLLFAGFYLEASSLLLVGPERSGKMPVFLTAILVAALLVFNGINLVYPHASVRVIVASLCVFFILVLPNVKMLAARDISGFKRTVGIFYLFFTTLQLLRAFYAFSHDIGLLSNSFIQSLTFIALVMLMVFGLSAYLLLMKEDADRVIAALASTDTLTELPNRRGFLDIAHRYFDRHQRSEKALTLLFLDIDHFKAVNDTYGHAFGDEVLVALAEKIRRTLRVGDLSCRYGGEEFILLLPDTDTAQAARAASRLMEAIRLISLRKYPAFSFTVSIGLMGGIPGPADSLEVFLEKADKALYHAKENGRNRVDEYSAERMEKPA